MNFLEKSYSEIQDRIRVACYSTRQPQPPLLIAVSKGQSSDAIERLYQLGQRDFGENYVQELLQKEKELRARCPALKWHFLGHLQTNKVKSILGVTNCIHSVDSMRLANEISKRAVSKVPVFLEVNMDVEETKFGFLPEEVAKVARDLASLEHILLEGFMCIPMTGSQSAFQKLKKLSEELGSLTLGRLSMGMSGDFEAAIAAGSTHIRVGTALFGERQ